MKQKRNEAKAIMRLTHDWINNPNQVDTPL
jgi:hypothetical protein